MELTFFGWETGLVVSIFLTTLFLGSLVYLQDKKNLQNLLFLGFSLSCAFLICSAYLSEFFPKTEPFLSLLLSKITFVSAIGLVIFFFFFSFIFPNKKKLPHYYSWPTGIIGLFLMWVILFTPLVISGIKLQPWGFDIVQGKLYDPVFLPLYILLVLASFVNLVINYRHSEGIQRTQLRYIFFGLGIFLFLGVFFGAILPLIIESQAYYRIGNYSAIFFVVFTAYAITKHHLFDIRVIITEVLTALISLGLLIDALLSKTFIEGGFKGILFVLVSYGGYRLVLSVREEIRRRQEIQQLTDQLKKANIRLQELDRLKSEFLSVASHELNSPMSIILGYLHMILFEGFGKVDKNARQYLEKVYFKSELLAKLVADLLNVSRIEQGRLKIEIQTVDLQSTLKDLCEDHALAAKEKGLTFTYHLPPKTLPKVLVDPDKLKEIIQNLLSNAVKFTKQGGVEVWAERTDSEVKVKVKDTGIGIPKEVQSHIFEKFYRVDNSLVREVGGTGLGLHLVQQYLSLMHGKIWFESAGENKGTTFCFTLPIAKKADEPI